MADFNPGEVYDALNDDSQLRARARQVDEMAKALVELCHTAVMEMANLALDEGGRGLRSRGRRARGRLRLQAGQDRRARSGGALEGRAPGGGARGAASVARIGGDGDGEARWLRRGHDGVRGPVAVRADPAWR